MEQDIELSERAVFALGQEKVAGYPDTRSCSCPYERRLALHIPRGRVEHVRVDYVANQCQKKNFVSRNVICSCSLIPEVIATM